jgi:hypothetical protein
MASVRSHARIQCPPEEAWAAVSDPEALPGWFPGVVGSTLHGDIRTVEMASGISVEERIVTNDSQLRRFQYKLLPGVVPVEDHLGTVDVIDDGDGCLVIYSADVQPDAMGPNMQASVTGAVQGLKEMLERR